MLGELAKLGAKLREKILFKKGVSAGSKALSSEIEKKLIDEGMKNAPVFTSLEHLKLEIKT